MRNELIIYVGQGAAGWNTVALDPTNTRCDTLTGALDHAASLADVQWGTPTTVSHYTTGELVTHGALADVYEWAQTLNTEENGGEA